MDVFDDWIQIFCLLIICTYIWHRLVNPTLYINGCSIQEMQREMMRGFDNGQTEKWTFAILELLKISSFLNAALLNSRAACNCLYSHFLFPPFSCSWYKPCTALPLIYIWNPVAYLWHLGTKAKTLYGTNQFIQSKIYVMHKVWLKYNIF